jgi:hypothetical protein
LAYLGDFVKVEVLPQTLSLAFGSLSLMLMIYVFQKMESLPSSTWEFFETEEGREVGGLVIVIFEMLVIFLTPSEAISSTGLKILYLLAFAIFAVAVYAEFFLQPLMNQRLQVEHCKGSL